MTVYELIQQLTCFGPNEEVIAVDRKNGQKYDVDYVEESKVGPYVELKTDPW